MKKLNVTWNANGVQITQVLLLDKSNGGDGIAVRERDLLDA